MHVTNNHYNSLCDQGKGQLKDQGKEKEGIGTTKKEREENKDFRLLETDISVVSRCFTSVCFLIYCISYKLCWKC